jgi:hypothetical protein
MVERQMQLAIQEVANFWYTAWINAGKPDLDKLDDPYTRKTNRKQLHYQYHLWEKEGKLTGMKPDLEF